MPKNTLPEQLEQKILSHILAGILTGNLPSERILCERFAAGRGTLRLALRNLEKAKVISPAGVKSVRKILAKTDPAANVPEDALQETQRIGFLTTMPQRDLPQSMLLEIYNLHRLLAMTGGMRLEIFECVSAGTYTPDAQLNRITKLNPCACWILYQTSEATQHWFKKHNLPCILRGTPFSGVKLPFLDRDWAAVVQHAATRLWQKGHRHVMLCLPEARLCGNILIKERFMSLDFPDWKPTLLRVPARPEFFLNELDRVFSKSDAPTAAILINGYDIVPLMAWGQRRGIAIPRDLSVISVSRQKFMRHLTPSFAVYEEDSEKMARKLKQQIRALLAGEKVRGRLTLPEFFPGESVRTI